MASENERCEKSVKKKRKRFSKKLKRSWRKHVDISDIEEHLAEERRQKRTGFVIILIFFNALLL